jgi:alkanesulfonate monooxygenase SsuD/methylene tetrahydromethanopterin reductase-like flavin-dependent oxidoreductase (luciferase family)
MDAITRMFVEEPFAGWSSEWIRMPPRNVVPKPLQRPHPPLILGGTAKPRFAALAARYADEVNTLGAPNEELRQRWERLERACEDAGRDPATLGFSVMTSCFVGADRAEALGRIGAFLDVRGGGDPEELLAQRADRWLAGTVDEVAERIRGLREVGVTRVFLQHLNHGDDEMVALIGERLLPALA